MKKKDPVRVHQGVLVTVRPLILNVFICHWKPVFSGLYNNVGHLARGRVRMCLSTKFTWSLMSFLWESPASSLPVAEAERSCLKESMSVKLLVLYFLQRISVSGCDSSSSLLTNTKICFSCQIKDNYQFPLLSTSAKALQRAREELASDPVWIPILALKRIIEYGSDLLFC